MCGNERTNERINDAMLDLFHGIVPNEKGCFLTFGLARSKSSKYGTGKCSSDFFLLTFSTPLDYDKNYTALWQEKMRRSIDSFMLACSF